MSDGTVCVQVTGTPPEVLLVLDDAMWWLSRPAPPTLTSRQKRIAAAYLRVALDFVEGSEGS